MRFGAELSLCLRAGGSAESSAEVGVRAPSASPRVLREQGEGRVRCFVRPRSSRVFLLFNKVSCCELEDWHGFWQLSSFLNKEKLWGGICWFECWHACPGNCWGFHGIHSPLRAPSTHCLVHTCAQIHPSPGGILCSHPPEDLQPHNPTCSPQCTNPGACCSAARAQLHPTAGIQMLQALRVHPAPGHLLQTGQGFPTAYIMCRILRHTAEGAVLGPGAKSPNPTAGLKSVTHLFPTSAKPNWRGILAPRRSQPQLLSFGLTWHGSCCQDEAQQPALLHSCSLEAQCSR